jgi:hypothetical protein
MRKWLILGTVGTVLLVAGVIVALLLPRPESPVNEAAAARVQPGLTEAEVEAVLGGPAGDYRVGSRAVTFEVGLAPPPGHVLKTWRGDDGLVLIQFGPDGRVAAVSFVPTPPLSNSFLDRLLEIFGL